MAAPEILDTESDYGYDFSQEEEALLAQLGADKQQLLVDAHQPPALIADIQSVGSEIVRENSFGHDENVQTFVASVGSNWLQRQQDEAGLAIPGAGPISTCISPDQDIEYPDSESTVATKHRSSELTDPKRLVTQSLPKIDEELGANVSHETGAGEGEFDDGRSPLQKFRSYPRRPLTVTDLTAGAWCELQYWYTLTRLPGGRRTKTQAMKGGSKIHQKLEDEVHTTVQVDVMTKEDGFALRLWNFISGLRSLRDTGLTRELEVWGMVDGSFVNGVIDAVGHQNPNPDLEKRTFGESFEPGPNQNTLNRYFTRQSKPQLASNSPKAFLTDVKTRGTLAPVSKALLRPAKIQLLLYHRFLADMAAGKLDFLKVFRRYGLDADDSFSDGFMAQIAGLHDDMFDDDEAAVPMSDQECSSDYGQLKYQTLRELVPLVNKEIGLTFPQGEQSLGKILRVQYVHRDDGRQIEVHDFPLSNQDLDTFLDTYMRWWHGERKAKGVDIEEAFKCRTCEFVSDCTWRSAMDEEQVRKAHAKALARRKSAPS